MAPEARIYYPPGQEEAFNAAIATVPGVIILGRKETKPLKVTEISAGKFIEFIQGEEPTLTVPKVSFQKAFASLQVLPAERQKKIITSFLTERVEGFPNAEDYAKFLSKLNSIQWFNLGEEPDQKQVRKSVNEYREKSGQAPIKISFVRDLKQALKERNAFDEPNLMRRNEKWMERSEEEERIRYELWRLAETTTVNTARKSLKRLIENSDWGLIKAEVDRWSNVMAYCIRSIIISSADNFMDMTSDKNPILPLLNIFQMGGWPLGEVKGKFHVFFPKQNQVKLSQ